MNEERRQILEMLSSGKITTDEAERLLAVLDTPPATASSVASSVPGLKPNPKYLRVLVEDQSQHPGKGHTQVNVRVPMQLLRAGVKLASFIPAQAQSRVNEALREQGIQLDLNHLKPENLEELIDQLSDLTVDVDDDHTKVRVFCE